MRSTARPTLAASVDLPDTEHMGESVLQALISELLRPLIERYLRERDHEREARLRAERERDALRAMVEQLKSPAAKPRAAEASSPFARSGRASAKSADDSQTESRFDRAFVTVVGAG